MYRIVYKRSATRVLRRMPRPTAQRIIERLEELAKNLHAKRSQVKRLRGRPGYRLRVGDWRILYRIRDEELEILVVEVGPRGGIYR